MTVKSSLLTISSQLLIVFPIIFIFMEYNKMNIFRVLIFVFIYIVYNMILRIPKFIPRFNIGKSYWTGKILGTIFGCLCFIIFKEYFTENNFFTIMLKTENIKIVLLVSYLMILIFGIISLHYEKQISFKNKENLLFQLTMPGIDEEIMFRGILLGLLMSSLKNELLFINLSLIIISILFGLVHGFTIDKNNKINFNRMSFIYTGIMGYVYGWITIETGSILLAIIIHNLYNFSVEIFVEKNKEEILN